MKHFGRNIEQYDLALIQELRASSISSKPMRGDVLVAGERETAAGWVEW